MERETLLTLEESPLFRGYQQDKLEKLLELMEAKIEDFSPGETFSLQEGEKHRVGILISGQMQVFSAGQKRVPLNRLSRGNLFGLSSLYGSDGAKTQVVGVQPGKVLFLEESHLEPLLEDPLLRRNLISFLTGRIRFLNRKIAFYTAPAATGKLARYLAQHADQAGRVPVPHSFSELAKILNLGRASLYRALGQLEEEGVIEKDGKEIRILSQKMLEIF